MGNLTITVADVAVIEELETFSGPAQEAITAGQYVRLNTTYGTVELGKATTSAESRNGGLAVNSAAAGATVKAIVRGQMDLGEALVGLSYDADIYLSDTDGTLATSTGTVSKVVGRVWPFWDNSTPGLTLKVEVGDNE
jgi:hypothetical protein